MEEYIKVLTEQIRCVKARDSVANEYRNHILDQAEYYEEDGLSHDDAIKQAVKEMGDPVAAGVELDHIHRPQMDWKMLIAVIVLNVLGVFMQYYIDPGISLIRQLMFVGIGSILMVALYFWDYSILAKHIELIYVGYFLTMIILEFILLNYPFRYLIAESGYYRVINCLYLPAYLFIFVYAGIMYKHRNEGIMGIIKSGLAAIPMFLYVFYGISSLPVMINLLVIMVAMSLFAIIKGWFKVNKAVGISLVVGVGLVFPFIVSVLFIRFKAAAYQVMRLKAFIDPYSVDPSGSGFGYIYLRNLLSHAELFSSSNNTMIPEGYILAQILCSYGLIIVLSVVIALLGIIIKVFGISFKQKNQLGMMLGFGFGVMLVVTVFKGILMNVGLFPGTTILLPFVTYGGDAIIGYSIFFGVLLSVYRYKNIYTDSFDKKLPKYKIKLSIQKNNL